MNKNQRDLSKGKSVEFTLKKFAIAIFVLLNGVGCGGQMNQKKNEQNNSDTIQIVTDNSNSVIDSSIQKDSIIYNQLKDGKKDGLWRTYYKNGILKRESIYKEDKKEGICKEWWETGKLWTEGMYENDKANGLMKWHNEEGILVASGNMTDGERDGKWRICDLHDASNCIEARFKEGKKDGIWKIYHDNGKVWKDQVWNEGKVISGKCWDEYGIEIECK